MDNRSQFTMYESVYKALQKIRKKSDKADAYDMICAYALYNLEPNLDNASDSVAIAFELIRPVLDSARKKAANGKQGGSKPKANGKQNASKKEREKEREKENEIEIEGEKEKEQTESELRKRFVSFWESYPNQIGEDDALEAWDDVVTDITVADRIIRSLDGWTTSEQWQEKGGRFIPRAAKFLREGYWKTPPADNSKTAERKLDVDELAAVRRMILEDGA